MQKRNAHFELSFGYMLWLKWLFSQSGQCLDLGSYNSNRAVWISRDNSHSVLLHSLWQQNWESENVSNGHLVHQLKLPFLFHVLHFFTGFPLSNPVRWGFSTLRPTLKSWTLRSPTVFVFN